MVLGVEKSSNKTKRSERPRQKRNGPKAIGPAADGSNVRTDTGEQTRNNEQARGHRVRLHSRRAQDDRPSERSFRAGYRGGRQARRHRSLGAVAGQGCASPSEPGEARNGCPGLPGLPIPQKVWRSSERRADRSMAVSPHRLLDAVHYLGEDDSYLDIFMDWRRAIITDKQRETWRALPTLVDHFKHWQSGTVPNKDRRTSDQKTIEKVRTEGHKADRAGEPKSSRRVRNSPLRKSRRRRHSGRF